MARRIDPRIHGGFVDANFWDISGDPLDDAAVPEIMRLFRRGEVGLVKPHSVMVELLHSNTPPEIKRQAAELSHTMAVNLTPGEQSMHARILRLIRGNARPGRHDRDAIHLFEAEKYGTGYFITKDVRLLKKAGEVESMLTSLRIVCPSEFMRYYRSGGI